MKGKSKSWKQQIREPKPRKTAAQKKASRREARDYEQYPSYKYTLRSEDENLAED